MNANHEMTYFQYLGNPSDVEGDENSNSYPVYIKMNEKDFSPQTREFILSMGFNEIPMSTGQAMDLLIETGKAPSHARMLNLSLASHTVARQIEMFRPDDRFGEEGLIPQNGYKVYRYRGVAMMVMSMGSPVWQMGCFENFGAAKNADGRVDEDLAAPFRTVLNRFLSWSLAPLGVVGLWGVPVDEGTVVMKRLNTKGEAVFFDVYRHQILSVDGLKKLNGRFQLMRLDSTLKGRSVPMKTEQLNCFLAEHCTYMDEKGPTVPIRQMVQTLSKMAVGMIYPRENFQPRTSLMP